MMRVTACLQPTNDLRYRRSFVKRLLYPTQRGSRVNFAASLAHRARRRFVENIAKGEAFVDLTTAALDISAEDDALISNSPVEFPVSSYLRRLRDVSRAVARGVEASGATKPRSICDCVETILFDQLDFNATPFGASNLPQSAVVDHPGVWEDQRYAYLHELLISKTGLPALLTILYQHVMKELLSMGVIDFVVTMDAANGDLPKGIPIPGLSGTSAVAADGTVLNTCTVDPLIALLRFLKRAFWPFAWDTNDLPHGGFRAGCQSVLFGEESAEHEAISRCAQHRLNRGIWTTTGGGDALRAVAACERLVLLCADDHPTERRDLAVLYYGVGDVSGAAAEIAAFVKSAAYREQPLQDRLLCDALLKQAIVNRPSKPLTVASFLKRDSPAVEFQLDSHLTW